MKLKPLSVVERLGMSEGTAGMFRFSYRLSSKPDAAWEFFFEAIKPVGFDTVSLIEGTIIIHSRHDDLERIYTEVKGWIDQANTDYEGERETLKETLRSRDEAEEIASQEAERRRCEAQQAFEMLNL